MRTTQRRPRAWITLRHQPPYRSGAFCEGMERLGYVAVNRHPEEKDVAPHDVVVTWNLNPRYRGAAHAAKVNGAALIVAENGYIPRAGESWYALARDGHNGSGYWFVGKEDRWAKLGRTIKPWAYDPKGHVVVADQRGIGSEIMRSPSNFIDHITPKLRRIFARRDKKDIPEFRPRFHPGRHAPKTTLAQDLQGARALVTWASNAANEALLMGYPAFRTAPFHVNPAVQSELLHLPEPIETDREAGFRVLAWAQWSLAEVRDGSAFKSLLRDLA